MSGFGFDDTLTQFFWGGGGRWVGGRFPGSRNGVVVDVHWKEAGVYTQPLRYHFTMHTNIVLIKPAHY